MVFVFQSGLLMGYYEEIITEIRTALADGNYDEASFLLKRELSMPYIPGDFEAELLRLQKDLRFRMSEKKERTEASVESLLRRLKGKPESQLRAVSQLCDRNLRSITAELRDWLAKDPQPEAASLLIDALAEQEIGEEFTIVRGGVEYTFYGDAVTPVAKSGGFRAGYRLLEDWLQKDPSILEMARSLLVQRCYNALPVSYEAEEGAILARECAEEVLRSMGLENRIPEIEEAYEKETSAVSLGRDFPA